MDNKYKIEDNIITEANTHFGWVTGDIKNVYNIYNDTENISFSVSYVGIFYWNKPPKNGGLGRRGPPITTERKKCPQKDMKFTIKIANNNILKNKVKLEEIMNSFYATPSVNDDVGPYKGLISEINKTDEVEVKYGIYKSKIFDDVYTSIKKVKPKFEPMELVHMECKSNNRYSDWYDVNELFAINKKYDGENDLIKSYHKTEQKTIKTGKYEINIPIIAIDINQNMLKLKQIYDLVK